MDLRVHVKNHLYSCVMYILNITGEIYNVVLPLYDDGLTLQGVPPKRMMRITEPESPALALKRRRLNTNHQTDDEQQEGKEETDSHVIRANPMPDMDKVFQPKLPHKKVEAQPFSFEERDKNKPNRETFVEMILRKEKVNLML